MSAQTINMSGALYDYYQHNSVREDPLLARIRERTALLPLGHMQSSPEQAQFVQCLLAMSSAKRCLELGTFTGYNALSMAMALPEDGEVHTCDIDADSLAIAKEFWQESQVSYKIRSYNTSALGLMSDWIESSENNLFDFIFIDADKANYVKYYELALQLLRRGGVIAVDNVLWKGRVADDNDQSRATKIIRKLNHIIHQDERVMMSLLPIGDGVTIAIKR